MAKRNRVTADKRSKDEIVADIMEILDAPLVEAYVCRLIDDLNAECPPFTGNRKNNAEYLNDLRNVIKRFKKLLRNAPAPLRTVLFSREFAQPLLELQGTAGHFNPRLRNYLAQRTPARLAELNKALDWLDAQCKETARLDLGTHAGADDLKLNAAYASCTVMDEAAVFNPNRELSFGCSRTSDYCRIASLFFEAVTGEHGSDLRRACEAIKPT